MEFPDKTSQAELRSGGKIWGPVRGRTWSHQCSYKISMEPFELTLCESYRFLTRTVVVASGARYERLSTLLSFDRFEGKGIHYAATAMEAQLCFNEEIVLVGGGNSAGQAAVYLNRSGRVSHVHMLVRSRNLSATMSSYLIERIQASPHISIHYESEIIDLDGTKASN